VAALIATVIVSTVKSESRDKRHFPHEGLYGGWGGPGGAYDFGGPGFRPHFPGYFDFRPHIPGHSSFRPQFPITDDDIDDGVNNK
jgi:hypothetical protein